MACACRGRDSSPIAAGRTGRSSTSSAFSLWALSARSENARALILAGRFILLGALFHIAEDALCGKVPLLHPKKKVGVRLFRVGSFGEYILALVLVLFFYGIGRLVLW